MTVTEYKTCPVCDGSKTRTKTQYEGLRSTTVKIPCTACEGKGKIPFIDLTKPKQEEENVEENLNVTGFSDGWRSSSSWTKIHYFRDGKSLCGNLRSPTATLSSLPVADLSSESICLTCAKKLD